MVNFATALTVSSRKGFLYITTLLAAPPNIIQKSTNLLALLDLSSLLSASLLLALALLEEGLRDEDLLLGRDGTVHSD